MSGQAAIYARRPHQRQASSTSSARRQAMAGSRSFSEYGPSIVASVRRSEGRWGMELFLLIAFGLPLVYLVVQIRALRRWEGIARKLAWVSALAAVIYVAKFAIDVSVDPSSHNMLPFELILVSLIGLGYLGVCAVGRKVAAWLG
jgi:hypothetical protein